jgi:hypothetical protein
VKRSPLDAGAKSRERGSTFAARPTPLKRSTARPRRQAVSEASFEQRAKVRFAPCVVCAVEGCDPAHLTPRGFRGCDHEDCVIALCRAHHRAFDDGALDLLPHIAGRGFSRELAHMQGHYDDPVSVLHRLTGERYVPERNAA